jgi:WD40 repeat protein
MSYCLKPNCPRPQNTEGMKFCITCGTKLLLVKSSDPKFPVAGRYRAIKIFSNSNWGRTFLGRDGEKTESSWCLIQQLLPSLGYSELFKQEASFLEKLNSHPQIPKIYDYIEQDQRQYIIQEFITGQNLELEASEKGTYSETEIRQILTELLQVLQFSHERAIVHGHINLHNIMRRSDDRQLILVNFSHQFPVDRTSLEAGMNYLLKRNSFLAPETSKSQISIASDIYSLGVVCLALMTGNSVTQLFDRQQNIWQWRKYLSDTNIGEELATILDLMVEPQIERRYQSVSEVLNHLQSLSLTSQQIIRLSIGSEQQPTWSYFASLSGHNYWVNSVTISPDGETLASGSWDKTIKLWHLKTGEQIYNLTGHTETVHALAFSGDGELLASGSWDKTIMLWYWQNGMFVRSLSGHSDPIYTLAFSRNGQILASGSWDKTIKLWLPLTGEELFTFKGHTDVIYALSFSPDGQFLASASGDKTIKIWHLETGQEIINIEGHQQAVYCLAWSRDGQILASGSWDKTIKIWQPQTGKEIAMLNGHLDSVNSLTFVTDRILASGSSDRTIKLWDLTDYVEIETLTEDLGAVYSLAASPDGQYIAAASSSSNIQIWSQE